MPTNGSSTKVSFRLDDDLLHAIQVVVQGKLSGFETMSDFLRAGVVAITQQVQDQNPDDPDLAEIRSLIIAERELQRADRFRRATVICNDISKSINDARNAGEPRWIGDTREAALNFAQSTPFSTLAERMRREAGL